MGEGGRPETVERIGEDVRDRTVAHLRSALSTSQLSLSQFESALDVALSATRESELVALVRRVAPPVRLVPPERQLADPLEISSSVAFENVNLKGAWQVPRQLRIRTGMAKITVDLTDAEFDDWTVEIVAHAEFGDVILIVPRGMAIQLSGTSGAPRSELEPAIPGFPVVKLSATVGFGKIRLRHPKQARRRRERA